ncbi:hypothetical protein KEM52_000259 [Ascosphaera acerosa]|nr:hypothetical protein KEM52_000259 [Ascosphaera acerosa]
MATITIDEGHSLDDSFATASTLYSPSHDTSAFSTLDALDLPDLLVGFDDKIIHELTLELPGTTSTIDAPILREGDVLVTEPLSRKKLFEHLTLTDTHLIRSRSQHKITPSSTSFRSHASIKDEAEMQISLEDVVAAHKTGDLQSTLEIWYIDSAGRPRSFQTQFQSLEECDTWLATVHSVTNFSRRLEKSTMEYITTKLQDCLDYDPDFHSRLASEVCYLVIGAHKVHLIPLEIISYTPMLDHGFTSNGILTIVSMSERPDATFTLGFRQPFREESTQWLSSLASSTIISALEARLAALRPYYRYHSLTINGDTPLVAQPLPSPAAECGEDEVFVRTLVAYSAAYGVNTSNICYSIEYEAGSPPCFRLQPPAETNAYTALELLAILRALRYDETFGAISFADISLDSLRGLYDNYGHDADASKDYDGVILQFTEEGRLTVLSEELRALALHSSTLTRLDLSRALSPTPGARPGKGCDIARALFPVCKRQLTNIDWIVLTGNQLSAADLDYIVDAASSEESQIRGLELGHCGLTSFDVDLIMSSLRAQADTLEVLDLSGSVGRSRFGDLREPMEHLKYIRKLVLSDVSYAEDKGFSLCGNTLRNWRLEELDLRNTQLGRQVVTTLQEYLASPNSHTLRDLQLDNCGLTDEDAATFMAHMMGHSGKARSLHIHLSGNQLFRGSNGLIDAVRQSKTPTHLTLRCIAFPDESVFRDLINAVRVNTSLEYLDISSCSLPQAIGLDVTVALREMLADNTALRYLDISGSITCLDSVCLGVGLNEALLGLTGNKTLETLKIERQQLGVQGAIALSSVLTENNHLRSLHCANNDFTLQSLKVLSDALAVNETLIELPLATKDREACIHKLLAAARPQDTLSQIPTRTSQPPSPAHRLSFRKTMASVTGYTVTRLSRSSSAASSLQRFSAPPNSPMSEICPPTSYSSTADGGSDTDLQSTIKSLKDEWDLHLARIKLCLQHNRDLAQGLLSNAELYRRSSSARREAHPDTRQSYFVFMKPVEFEGLDSKATDRPVKQVTVMEFLQEMDSAPALSKPETQPTVKQVQLPACNRKNRMSIMPLKIRW